MIPLENRVCAAALIAGVAGTDNDHPVCIGKRCSKWECCSIEMLNGARMLDALKKHPTVKRISKGEKWGVK